MLLRVTDGAKELGLSTEQLRRMIRAGKFPTYRLGPRSTRIDVAEIRNLTRSSALVEKIKG